MDPHAPIREDLPMLAAIIDDNRDAIAALCRKHRVEALWVFGSATSGAWNPETSDVDFLVDLGQYEPGIAMRYLDLADDLEALMGCSIDLVSIGGLRNNPRLRDELERTRMAIYERGDTQAVA
jgi:hypothetical protein